MKEELLDIAKKLYHNHLTPETATNLLLDLFAVSSRTLIPNEIKDELQRRIGIIESETDDFTRQSMISNLTTDLI